MFCQRLDWDGQKFVGWIDGSNEGEEGMGKYDIQGLLLAIQFPNRFLQLPTFWRRTQWLACLNKTKQELFFKHISGT